MGHAHRLWQFVWIALACAVLAPATAGAHAMQTAYLELVEGASGRVTATWKVPIAGNPVTPVLEGCQDADGHESHAEENHSPFIRHLTFDCPGGLPGRRISVGGLGIAYGEVIVRVSRADGTALSQVLRPSQPAWTIPKAQGFLDVFPRYVWLGIEHILSGADHLLFVLGLVLLIGPNRRRDIVWTATAFTLAHSITLSLTSLGWIRVQAAVAEAFIAATLVLLALDIGKQESNPNPRPQAVAFVFGLVHGFGFAGALAEIGLPEGAVAPALFAFNVGVELGQLAFIVVVLLLFALLAKLSRTRPNAMKVAGSLGAYLIGCLGVFWLMQRWDDMMNP